MSADPTLYRLTCGRCQWQGLYSLRDATVRLRDAGKLRRSVDPEPDLIAELFRSAAAKFACDGCGHVGLSADSVDADPDWPDPVKCEVCGTIIPSERLEVFPDARRCVRCQTSGAEPDERVAADFCKHCGGLLTMKKSGGSGITRYKMVCGDCGR